MGRICHNQKTRFTESRLNLICECARCEPPSNGGCSSVSSKFQNCPLTIITWGYHKHFRWMFDGNNSTSSKQHFLPRTTQVNYIIAWENLRVSSSSSRTSNFSDPPSIRHIHDANISKIHNVAYLELNSDMHRDLFFSSCLVTAVLSNSQIIV